MQKLHLVGLTSDRRGLIFSTRRGAKSGSYVVSADPDLSEAVAALATSDDVARPTKEELARESSSLSVREVQALLRRGRSIEAVAASAGVSPQWVGRFAAPVLAEREAVLDELQAATFDARRKGPSSSPLGPSIRWHLLDKGVRDAATALTEGWTASQLEGDDWVASFRYENRGRRFVARWRFDRRSGEVTAENRLAAELAFVAPAAPGSARRAGGAPRTAARTAAAKESAARRPAAKKKPPSAKSAPGTKAAPKRSPAKKMSAKNAAGTKVLAKKAAVKGSRAGKPPAVRRSAATNKPSAAKRSAVKKPAGKGPVRKRPGASSARPTANASTAPANRSAPPPPQAGGPPPPAIADRPARPAADRRPRHPRAEEPLLPPFLAELDEPVTDSIDGAAWARFDTPTGRAADRDGGVTEQQPVRQRRSLRAAAAPAPRPVERRAWPPRTDDGHAAQLPTREADGDAGSRRRREPLRADRGSTNGATARPRR